jgi:hypothetical protein
MKIFIESKGKSSNWKESLNLHHFVESTNPYWCGMISVSSYDEPYGSTPIILSGRGEKEKAIWAFLGKCFVQKIEKMILLGLAKEVPCVLSEHGKVFFTIEVFPKNFKFPSINIDGQLIEYGAAAILPETKISCSTIFRPEGWFTEEDYGNCHNGGTLYLPTQFGQKKSEQIKLEAGYALILSKGSVDGWGLGFGGGAFIISK